MHGGAAQDSGSGDLVKPFQFAQQLGPQHGAASRQVGWPTGRCKTPLVWLNAFFGLWWADPLAALIMVPIIAKEGIEGLQGTACDDCCAR
jgi:hypothetical protein